MKVKRLGIHNFRHFVDLEIEFDERLNVFVGINGAGKTSILDVLAIMLSRLIGRIQSSQGTGRFFSDADIHMGASETVNNISITYKGINVDWSVTKTKRGRRKQTISNLGQVKKVVDIVQREIERDDKISFPLAVYYSVNRAVLDIPLRIRTQHKFEQLDAYNQALTGARNDFRLFFEWFREREDLENQLRLTPGQENIEYRDPQLQAVRDAIESIAGFLDIRISRNPLRMEVSKEENVLNVGQLSDGEKCSLALAGDLARRLAIANPGMAEPLNGTGVVLIDELDLHLHPASQQEIVGKLMATFPNCQFIVTTHSPQILTTLRAENIRMLLRDEKGVWQTAIPSRSPLAHEPGDVLASIMDTHPKPEIEGVSRKLREYERLTREGKARTEEAEKIKNELEQRGYQFNEADIALFNFLSEKAKGERHD